jgi:DNA repair photolyase
MQVREVTTKTILTPTGGFLSAYSHTLNPYRGCTYGNSLCGAACYAPEVRFGGARGEWGTYLDVKMNAPDVYRADHDRWRRTGARLVVFMSSVTDPYVPQERRYRITRGILRAMVERPPDALVLQTHTPHPLWDADALVDLLGRTRLLVQISVETDREDLPGFRRHAYPVAARVGALGALQELGITTVAVVSPLMPLADPEGFARRLGEVARFVILDHYLIGDGSSNGARTRRWKPHIRDTVPHLLTAAGFEAWTRLETFHEVVGRFTTVLGEERVGVSAAGFNRLVREQPDHRASCG